MGSTSRSVILSRLQTDTANLRPDMKLSSETQGSFNCADHDIKIGSNAYNHSRFGNIPIEVTSSTSFVETSGNAEWNYNGSSWVVTVQKDIPFVASNGTVAGFDRVHSNNSEENKNKNSFGEDLVEHVRSTLWKSILLGSVLPKILLR